jgi:hypothetical protein
MRACTTEKANDFGRVDRIFLPPHCLSTQTVGWISHGTQTSRLRSKRRQVHDLDVRWDRGVDERFFDWLQSDIDCWS